jgi:pimeloyl-ACP methyl ester carboxylesterase
LKRFFIVTGLLVAAGILSLLVWVYATGPGIPAGTDDAIREALSGPLPDFIGNDTGHVVSYGLKIWYESLPAEASERGTVLLFTGIASDALFWPDPFLHALRKDGWRVVRYDYRGTGSSDRVTDWKPEHLYTLRDLAADALVILDSLRIEKARLVGISMGGMVAQEFAINFPSRAASLTCIMSTGFITDPDLPQVPLRMGTKMLRTTLRYGIFQTEPRAVKMFLTTRQLLTGRTKLDLDLKLFAQKVLYEYRHKRVFSGDAVVQHLTAIQASGSRYPELALVAFPALVIHGTADPLIPIAQGRKLASVIPGADTLWVHGMGHDLSRSYLPQVTRKILDFLK